MPVIYRSDDITLDDADLLINTVNVATARMGKGIALQFKNRWPSILPAYEEACRTKTLIAGGCILLPLPDGRQWAALATKHHWSNDSRLDWVASGIATLAYRARIAGVRSIAIPPPGCGNGGLDWCEVEPLVLGFLSAFDLRIYGRPSQP